MTAKGCISVWGLLLLLVGVAPASFAQEAADPADDPAGDEPAVAPVQPEPAQDERRPNGLYVGVAGGIVSADAVNTSVASNPDNVVFGSLTLEDQLHARASIGWKLPERKGAFRLMFQGSKEDGYSFDASGQQLRVGADLSASATKCVTSSGVEESCLVEWWTIDAEDGRGVSRKYTPMWQATDWLRDGDGNLIFDEDGQCILNGTMRDDRNYPELGERCNGLPDPIEIRYLEDGEGNRVPSRTVDSMLPDSLQNQLQNFDLVYGREFGRRRFSSRWWAGVRYFEYQGNLLAGAWLNLQVPGAGITDGTLLRFLSLHQETTGFGPTGSWEVDFNFFDRGVELFLRGQSAFMFNSLEMDSDEFFFPVPSGDDDVFVAARLVDSRDKSSWQNTGELGARLNFKNGLQIEAGYFISGYLDVLLLPANFSGLDNFVFDPENVPRPEDALGFNTGTQDIVQDGWYSGVSYQF